MEAIWLEESSDEQPFLQGIIQAAVAFFHFQEGRRGAARKMLELAIEKLSPYPKSYRGVHLAPLLFALEEWKGALDSSISEGSEPPEMEYPTIDYQPEGPPGRD